MPYRIPAINEAVMREEAEIAAFGNSVARKRVAARRIVCATLAAAFALALLAAVQERQPATAVSEHRQSCIETSCFCWIDDADYWWTHAWTRVSCPTIANQRACFAVVGTCVERSSL